MFLVSFHFIIIIIIIILLYEIIPLYNNTILSFHYFLELSIGYFHLPFRNHQKSTEVKPSPVGSQAKLHPRPGRLQLSILLYQMQCKIPSTPRENMSGEGEIIEQGFLPEIPFPWKEANLKIEERS